MSIKERSWQGSSSFLRHFFLIQQSVNSFPRHSRRHFEVLQSTRQFYSYSVSQFQRTSQTQLG